MKYLSLWPPGLPIFFFFFEKNVKSSGPPCKYLMYAPLPWEADKGKTRMTLRNEIRKSFNS